MPIQAVAIAFVVVALAAIVWRFTPRSADGSMRLPTLIDRSVGMWLLRRALGRTGNADRVADDERSPVADWNANAGRDVAPGSPLPTMPTRFVVSSASFRAQPATPEASPEREPRRTTTPVASLAARSASAGRGSTYAARPRRPSGALAAQRRSAGAVALAVVAIAVTTIALGTRQLEGQVLSATGTPAGSAGGGFVGGPADDSPAGSGEPSSSPAP
jgi:hypothetical protein